MLLLLNDVLNAMLKSLIEVFVFWFVSFLSHDHRDDPMEVNTPDCEFGAFLEMKPFVGSSSSKCWALGERKKIDLAKKIPLSRLSRILAIICHLKARFRTSQDALFDGTGESRGDTLEGVCKEVEVCPKFAISRWRVAAQEGW